MEVAVDALHRHADRQGRHGVVRRPQVIDVRCELAHDGNGRIEPLVHLLGSSRVLRLVCQS